MAGDPSPPDPPSLHATQRVADPSRLAAGPAAGYQFQFEVALLLLVPHALTNADVAVSLELLDDVALHFGDEDPLHVLQVAHSVDRERPLLDTDAKVWKTLAIWAGEWAALEAGETRVMTLLTTRPVVDGSALHALTGRARADPEALKRLEEIAADQKGAPGTAANREAFMTLPPSERAALVRVMHVVDAAPQVVDVQQELERLLAPAHELRFVRAMAEMVHGRWWFRVAQALSGNRIIRAEHLREDIDEARRTISDRALPILAMSSFDSEELPEHRPDATYLACLDEIKASQFRRQRAIDDFRRASAHRLKWARLGLVGPREFSDYEADLRDQWLTACDRMLRALEAGADEAQRCSSGHDLWDRLEEDIRRPLRPETQDGFIQRGSLHRLADEERIGWHPDRAAPIVAAGSGSRAA